MKRYKIPHTDLDISVLCYGVAGFGTGADNERADALLAQFLEAGGNFLDTAHCYAFWLPGGLGASERGLGASIRRLDCRDRVVIATKGCHPDGGPDYRRPVDFLSEALLQSDLEESLERLGVEAIDLYYLHRDDGRTPVEEIIDRLNREIRRGRICWFGASNWSVGRMAAANDYAARSGQQGFVISQAQWSLADPDWKAGADPTVRSVTGEEIAWHSASQLPIAAYSATANGFFAGDGSKPRSYVSPANQGRLERAQALAVRLGCTPTQVALAYLMRQPFPVFPLFSTLNPEHLAEALAAVDVTLSDEEICWLRDVETG